MNLRLILAALLAAGCATGRSPEVVPTDTPRPVPPFRSVPNIKIEIGRHNDRREAAAAAFYAGLLPLHSTGVDRFSELAPTADGRGVLIAILDSGIDPSVPGLGQSSDGTSKLIDLRDLSGEGDISLERVDASSDTIALKGHHLLGADVLKRRSDQEIWAGLVSEVRYGNGPGADLNDNGVIADTLMVVVARGATEWIMLADSDGDGTIADERPVRDFSVAQDWFGWSHDGGTPRLGIAVTLRSVAGEPRLTLVFDTSGHGTHVAGIAAGHDLYDIAGFDGVAPGARIIGLKISNNANRVTTSGSMKRALEYAIKTAKLNRLPLVVNLSFGIGSQPDQTARINTIIDSILEVNPDLVLSVAATNQGPGLGTMGFPATAHHTLAVGATSPRVFDGMPIDHTQPDPIAWFSSRGGPHLGPDLLAPGTAWSVVPRFMAGSEEMSGTSMAAPHVAGLVARLISFASQHDISVNRAILTQALKTSAGLLPDANNLDQGYGLPQLDKAAHWLSSAGTIPEIRMESSGFPHGTAVWFAPGIPPSKAVVRIWRVDHNRRMRVRIRSTAGWLDVQGPVIRELPVEGLTLQLEVDSAALATPGVRVAELLIENADNLEQGVIATIPVTARIPLGNGVQENGVVAVQGGASGRLFFAAQAGHGFQVSVTTLTAGGRALVALHEPDGQPYRDIPITPVGQDNGVGIVTVDAANVRSGTYEVVVVAAADNGVAARVTVTKAPVEMNLVKVVGGFKATSINTSADTQNVRLRATQKGMARSQVLGPTDSTNFSTPLVVPRWATSLVLDISLPNEVWSGLTDFGVSLRGPAGRLIQEAPLSHPSGRIRIPMPPSFRSDTLMLVMTPAFADDPSAQTWSAMMTVRFEAESSRPLDRGGTARKQIPPGSVQDLELTIPVWPLSVPPGWSPVVAVATEVADNSTWTREVILSTEQD